MIIRKIFIRTLFISSIMFAFQTKSYSQSIDNAAVEKAMIHALEWQEAHPIFAKAPTDWTNGAYQVGIAKAHDATKNAIFLAALKNVGYHNGWDTYDRVYHADDMAVSYGYLYLEQNDTRKNYVDLKPTEDFIQKHIYEPNKWSDGSEKDPVKSILWWWCDALFMAPPALVLYANQTGDMKHMDTMHKFYKETYDLLYDEEEHLFARDTRFVWTGSAKDLKEENGEKIFWSRGNGWVLGGLALILEDMPKDYKHRDFYVGLYKEMAAKIKDIQHKDGLWYTSLLYPESFNHGEVSGSGFYTFALTWGINNGLLDKAEYTPVVKKAWSALAACQHDNGMVGWVQNIGASPEPASYNSWQNFGTGAFLLAGSEIIKLK